MGESKTAVLYIAGLGRSGSTLIGNVLGEISGFFHGGELNFLWEHSLIENRLCGCGAPFHECEVWEPIMREAFGGTEGVDAREMVRLQSSGTRTRYVPLMLFPRGRSVLADRLEKYMFLQEKLYRAIREVTGSRVVVDSSKSPAYGYLLGMTPGIDLYVVHLVRDPRAAAYSWLRKKPQPSTDELVYMDQVNTSKSSLLWATWNLSSEALWQGPSGRYTRVRYEDFVENPRRALGDILGMAGQENSGMPFADERSVELIVNHTVSGNPNRFRTERTQLLQDNEWAHRMKTRDKALVTLLTLPLLPRYGYPFFAGKTRAG